MVRPVPGRNHFLGQLLSLIYIKELADGIQSICKTFVDDPSLVSKCHNLKKNWSRIKQRSHYYQRLGLPVENGF